MQNDSPPPNALFRVIHAGAMTSLQDGGRAGLKAYGIPPSGAMDQCALERLNRLFDQAPQTAAWEMLWAGMNIECLRDCWIAFSGGALGLLDGIPVPADCALRVRAGQNVRFQASGQSIWSYLTVAGGWQGPQWFGSQSVWPDGGMGRVLHDGDHLLKHHGSEWNLPESVAARWIRPSVVDHHDPFPIYAGPQWEEFSLSCRAQFLQSQWRISPQSNRAGYRLQGPVLEVPTRELISEPTLLGSIQVPANGQPIVLLNDGPTLGGYHKIALIQEADLDRFRQLPPGHQLQFSLIS